MIHIDFWFEDRNGQLVVVGWSDVQGVQLRLNDQTRYVSSPRLIDRYSRADLATVSPLAFVAVFAPQKSGDGADAPEQITVVTSDSSKPLTDQGKGFRAIAETAVKEAYDRVLLLMSTGEVVMTVDAECASVVKRRMANYPTGTMETIQFAVSVDTGLMSRDGAGLLNGWFLVHPKYSACKLHGFKLSSSGISKIRVFPGQIERLDLEGYGNRYNFTGRDGFVASTIQSTAADGAGDSQIFLAVDMGTTTAIVLAQMQNATPQLVGRMLSTSHHALKRIDQRKDLMEGFLGQPARAGFDEAVKLFRSPTTGGTAIIVDVDVAGDFVGDLCLSFYTQDLSVDRIILMVDQNDSAAVRSVDRTIAELDDFPEPFQITTVDRGSLNLCLANLNRDGCGRLLFARASVLYHLMDTDVDLISDAILSEGAQVVVFSRRAEEAGILTAEISSGYQPVVVAGPLVAMQSALNHIPEVFMTEEGMLKYVTARLADCFTRKRAKDGGFVLGQNGKNNEVLVWGQNAYTVDSLVLSVMSKAGYLQ